ncbi:MAG: hypothetical protein FWF45_00020 [Coriobacteriia bacterium]|nr:hypothetical protein [Coriobacteriia bacterium]
MSISTIIVLVCSIIVLPFSFRCFLNLNRSNKAIKREVREREAAAKENGADSKNGILTLFNSDEIKQLTNMRQDEYIVTFWKTIPYPSQEKLLKIPEVNRLIYANLLSQRADTLQSLVEVALFICGGIFSALAFNVVKWFSGGGDVHPSELWPVVGLLVFCAALISVKVGWIPTLRACSKKYRHLK